MKKEGSRLFDVAMGSYNGAEVSELVGMFALSQLPKLYNRCDIGLYRDDGLAVFMGMSGSMTQQDIIKSFNDIDLRITIRTNLKTVNFLDITLNLCNGKYYPYRKPNDWPLYINSLSNHATLILRHLPAVISKSLTDISYDTEVLKEAAFLYNNALKDSGFHDNVEYAESRKGKEIWSTEEPCEKDHLV